MRNLNRSFLTNNLKRWAWDVSGAFGDIGVLFPISIALIAKNGFNPAALLIMAGAFYLLSAYYFKLTMPVQPLKAMSAIAIATGMGFEVINAAGMVFGAILLLLAVGGFTQALGILFPLPVVRGIQLGLGLLLLKSSLGFMAQNIPLAAISGVLLLATLFFLKQVPPLIPLLSLGIILTLGQITPSGQEPALITPLFPSVDNLWLGFVTLVIPQLALTFGNAVVATEATARCLYREKAGKLNYKNLPVSMGIANMVSGLMGGAPMCHGSSGVTAHYKFGATSERSGFIIGVVLLVMGLFFAELAVSLIAVFPIAILGAMLCYVSIEHALLIRDIRGDVQALTIALSVAIIGFISGNLTAGFISGTTFFYLLKLFKYIRTG